MCYLRDTVRIAEAEVRASVNGLVEYGSGNCQCYERCVANRVSWSKERETLLERQDKTT